MAKLVSILFTLVFLVGCGATYQTDNTEQETCDMAMKDGWSQSGDLITGNTDGIVQLQATFEKDNKGTGAQYYTVQLGVTPPTNGVYAAQAEVTWKTEGNTVRRLISVGNGAVISGTAQACTVKVRDVTPDFDPSLVSKPYTVTILITPGCRPSEGMPARLFQIPDFPSSTSDFRVIAGNSLTVPIPQNAGVTSVNITAYGTAAGTEPTAGTAEVLVNGSGSFGTISKIIPDSSPSNSGAWVPIPPYATSIVLNAPGADDITFSVTWGIEG